jgi:poly(A) polymerase
MIDIKKHILNNTLFKIASDIAFELNTQVFVVGGFVRDLILNRERSDIDFLVVGDGLNFASKLS